MAWNPYGDMMVQRLERMNAQGATVAQLAKARREMLEASAKRQAAKKAREAK